jgi:hypothetical protein
MIDQKQIIGAQSLAERSRYGDQNAMGMIEQIRKNAEGGSDVARNSYAIILQYIQEHPAEGAQVGAETAQALGVLKDPDIDPPTLLRALCFLPQCGDPGAIEGAICILSFGPAINTARIAEVSKVVPPTSLPTFKYGLANAADQKALAPVQAQVNGPDMGYLCAGHAMGTARRIQLARMPASKPAVLGADIGCEFGSE